MRRRANSRRGQALLELLLGTISLALVLLGMVALLTAHAHRAASLAAEARLRYLLEGELECLRGAEPPPPGESATFTPALGVPQSLAGYRFVRAVENDPETGAALVRLAAEPPGTNLPRVEVCGLLPAREGGGP